MVVGLQYELLDVSGRDNLIFCTRVSGEEDNTYLWKDKKGKKQ